MSNSNNYQASVSVPVRDSAMESPPQSHIIDAPDMRTPLYKESINKVHVYCMCLHISGKVIITLAQLVLFLTFTMYSQVQACT